MAQPIISGIQAVGGVNITYSYPAEMYADVGTGLVKINAINGVKIVGFLLDSEFLRAAQHIASSSVRPILGGGAIALTNNNRSGTLTIASTRVGLPNTTGTNSGALPAEWITDVVSGANVEDAYDIVTLAQAQQASPGGDSLGATLMVSMNFSGSSLKATFRSCTVANVSPLALSGSDLPDYAVTFNYLNWTIGYQNSTVD
jgi:hypothetical protein